MSTREERRPRRSTKRGRQARRDSNGADLYKSSTPRVATPTDAHEHYHREKARRANRGRSHDHPLEQARRAYHALLESDAARAKGGRPKKAATPKPDVHRDDSEKG